MGRDPLPVDWAQHTWSPGVAPNRGGQEAPACGQEQLSPGSEPLMAVQDAASLLPAPRLWNRR